MKKIILKCTILLLLYGCVKETQIVKLELSAKLKGLVFTFNEFNSLNDDREGIFVQLEGADDTFSTFTDAEGVYEFDSVSSGTYNLIFSKEGYGTTQEQGIKIVGGDESVYQMITDFFEISTISLENLTLEQIDEQNISLNVIFNHNFVDAQRFPVLIYYLHTSPNLSSTNYLQKSFLYFYGASGTQLSAVIEVNRNKFPSGSTIYAIAYGSPSTHASYYDIQTGLLIFPSLGEASNTASIIIP